jgi:hypothetical protein
MIRKNKMVYLMIFICKSTNKKASIKEAFLIQCRGGRIRTCDPLLPKQDDTS